MSAFVDGANEGLAVGISEGGALGDKLGKSDGIIDGIIDGTIVGTVVGLTIAIADGYCDGDSEVLLLGVVVFWSAVIDGATVWLFSVGERMLWVGAEMEIVGLYVGAWVRRCAGPMQINGGCPGPSTSVRSTANTSLVH